MRSPTQSNDNGPLISENLVETVLGVLLLIAACAFIYLLPSLHLALTHNYVQLVPAAKIAANIH